MNDDDSNKGLKQAELVRLHALQVTDPGLATEQRVAQAEAFAAFLFGRVHATNAAE